MDDDVLPQEALAILEKATKPYLGKNITPGTIIRLNTAVYDACVRIRNKGFKMPRLVPVILEHRGYVAFARADLEQPGINRVIQNLIRQRPQVTVPELVIAIKRAWPKYKPDDTGNEADRVITALKAKYPEQYTKTDKAI